LQHHWSCSWNRKTCVLLNAEDYLHQNWSLIPLIWMGSTVFLGGFAVTVLVSWISTDICNLPIDLHALRTLSNRLRFLDSPGMWISIDNCKTKWNIRCQSMRLAFGNDPQDGCLSCRYDLLTSEINRVAVTIALSRWIKNFE
jgi:hypothetical protein